eukprot:CAMPEP_0204189598 /NCGR_PEP_ID=MMETSP0361-20130328/58631_1 /ASSEMBLY_ACC=CAM_ASM_000343 /TAXON_ID=268821 /ORGANISM="Scrippsiella Hangoei, Strain SHTV-5" /LENGTH=56 /DNA_ID=CAMNT_0051150305 /DNA_START=7 /DNA_END=176 /DNA_ORIENTATION=+
MNATTSFREDPTSAAARWHKAGPCDPAGGLRAALKRQRELVQLAADPHVATQQRLR